MTLKIFCYLVKFGDEKTETYNFNLLERVKLLK